MKLANQSRENNCSKISTDKYYITDKLAVTYEVKINSGNEKSYRQRPNEHLEKHYNLPKLAFYNSRLMHMLPKEVDRLTVIESLDTITGTLEGLIQ